MPLGQAVYGLIMTRAFAALTAPLQVMMLRRQLLAKLRVREFAHEGLSTEYCR
jgi:hypothetical protein